MVTTKEFFYIRIFTLKLTIMLRKKNNIISPMLILFMLPAFFTACTASENIAGQKRAEKAEQVSTVLQNALNSKHFTLNVNNMYPVSASSKYVGGEFFLEVKGDTLRSYLPYFGAIIRPTIWVTRWISNRKWKVFSKFGRRKIAPLSTFQCVLQKISSNTHSTSSTMVVLTCMYCQSIASLSPTMANLNSKYFPRKA